MSKVNELYVFIKGVLWGGVVGLGAGLLLAPASGERTLQRLRERSSELADQAQLRAEQALARAEALQARAQEALATNAERVSRTAEAARRSAIETWRQEAPQGAPLAATMEYPRPERTSR
jgi:gas vesicle protein